MATTSGLLEEVLAHQFAPTRYSNLIITWLNEAQKRIYRKSSLRTAHETDDFSTVSGTEAYTLPTDYARMDQVVNLDLDETLVRISQEKYDNRVETSGTPYNWVVFGDTLFLYPEPNAVINMRLRYWELPPDITSGVDPVIPDDYAYLLREYALARAYEAEHDFQASEYHQGKFDLGLIDLRDETTEDSRPAPVIIKGSW